MPRTPPARRETGASATALSRRGLLAAIGASALGAAVPTVAASQAAAEWGMFQADPANTGVASTGGPSAKAGARWGFTGGEECTTAPVATADTVFVADDGAGVVRALATSDGTERWSTDVDVSDARIAVDDGTVYVPTPRELVALDAADGSEAWTAAPDCESVNLENGQYAYTSGPAGLSRVSLDSGEVLWERDRIGQPQGPPAVADQYVYIGGRQYGSIIARDAATGGRLWFRQFSNLDPAPEGVAQDAPTRAGKAVVLPIDDRLLAFKFDTGIALWQYRAEVHSSVAAADGVVYGTTAGEEAVAVRVSDGEEVWRASAPLGSNPPAIAGDLLYVTGTDGSVAALSLSDGSTVWQSQVGAGRSAGVAVAGGELYVADEAGQVAALTTGASGGLGGETPTAVPATETDGDGGGEPGSETPVDSPGFGLAAGAAALGAGALAARRRDDAE